MVAFYVMNVKIPAFLTATFIGDTLTSVKTIPYLIYEDRPRYDRWFKLLIASIILITLVPAIALYPFEPEGTWVLLASTVFDSLLFHAVTPRRFQVYNDRLRIVLGRPFAVNLSLTNIKEARAVTGTEAFAYWGVRFATSKHTVIEIVRYSGLNLVISPSDRETFLLQLNQALKTASRPT
jgi:hypothetical protein